MPRALERHGAGAGAQRRFARTFSGVLRTPYTPWRSFLPFGPPDALLRLMVGEVAGVITTGQRVVPAKALALGYRFKYPHLADALRDAEHPSQGAPSHRRRRTRPSGLIIDRSGSAISIEPAQRRCPR